VYRSGRNDRFEKEGKAMRRHGLVAGLLVIMLLGLPGGAVAQIADPLGLASVGVVLPYWIGKADVSMLQVASPVGDNTGPSQGGVGPAMQLVFFNNTCTRTFSKVLPLTINDVDFVSLEPFTSAGSGLVVISGVDATGLDAVPLQNPIHARLHWINVKGDFARVVDPITVQHAGTDHRWNPLQTAATFYAPLLEPGRTDATLYLVCPTVNITGDASTSGLIQGAPLPPSNGIATFVFGVVYDDEELFMMDTFMPCSCLTSVNLASVGGIYTNAVDAPNGTYTELVGGSLPDRKRFTGYLGIRARHLPDNFGRLQNGPAESILAPRPPPP
jgi:hypothetical protein